MRKLFACMLALVLLLGGVCTAASAATTGGWEILTTQSAMLEDAQARKALETAMKEYAGYKVKPLALLGTQVADGINYCILGYGSTVTQTPKKNLCLVYVCENPDGKCEIIKIKTLSLKEKPAGGWKVTQKKSALKADSKVTKALKKATAELAGASYKALLVLARDKTNTAFCVLCRKKVSDAGGSTGLCLAYLTKRSGHYQLIRVDDLKVAR